MMPGRSTEIWLAVFFAAFAALAFFLWVPNDSETPPIYTFRRQTYIGDAMLPLVAAAGIGICAVIQLVLVWMRSPDTDTDAPFDVQTVQFFAAFAAILAVSLGVMFWSGPTALALFGPGGEDAPSYRQMRDTLPWKYVGFILGGFILAFGTTALIEGRPRAKSALIVAAAIAILILIFDVPFDTILLPPNGDF